MKRIHLCHPPPRCTHPPLFSFPFSLSRIHCRSFFRFLPPAYPSLHLIYHHPSIRRSPLSSHPAPPLPFPRASACFLSSARNWIGWIVIYNSWSHPSTPIHSLFEKNRQKFFTHTNFSRPLYDVHSDFPLSPMMFKSCISFFLMYVVHAYNNAQK